MLPTITAFYAGIAAILVILLSLNVSRNRLRFKVGLGDGGNNLLNIAIRMHGNAIETIPLTFLLMAFVEMQDGLATLWLHVIAIAFLLARMSHAYGLSKSVDVSIGRSGGIVVTWLVILILAITNIFLFFTL